VVVVNMLAENVLSPTLMGRGLNPSPTIVFLSFIFWAWLLGGPGAFLALPLNLNPLEKAFSKIKGLVRKAEAGTREALVEAIGSALSEITSRDARNFFEHCGYQMSVQSLW
jgi:hypothetical protein